MPTNRTTMRPTTTHQITPTSILHLCSDGKDGDTNDPKMHHNKRRAIQEEIKFKTKLMRENIRAYKELRSTEYKPMLLNPNHTQ